MKSLVVVGATSALMLAGLTVFAAAPASAAGAPNKLVFTGNPSSTATAGSSTGLTTVAVSVEDSVGNVETSGAGSTDVITLVANGNPSMTGNVVAAVNGVATFSSLVIDTAGTYTFTATDSTTSGLTSGSSTPPVVVSAAAANKIAFTTAPPADATLGAPLTTFKVSVEDTFGNVVTTGTGAVDTINITTASAGCSVAGTDSVAAVNGVATFSNVNVATGTSCALTATDTLSPDNSFTPVISAAITVASSTPVKVGFSTAPPASATAGVVLPSFAVSIEESNGITVASGTGSTDTVTITSACTLEGTTSAVAVAGVATFNALAIKTGASCTLIAADATRTLATATSNLVTVLAGAATKVVFTTAPPTTVTTAGTLLTTFKVSVEDTNGNVITSGTGTNDTITITAASPCTLGGTTTGVAVAGVATFSLLSVSDTGVCVLTATDSTRALTTAAATTTVGTAQAALSITSLKGLVGTPLAIKTSGGTGAGAVTLTTTSGTAGCSVSGGAVKAARAGTCLVTATKAGTTTYIAVSSAATTVTFVLPFKVTRVAGSIFVGRTQTITLIGSGFTGRPRIIANVGGFSARVTQDTGRTLRVIVTVSATARTGVHSMTVILANGKRASVKFSLR